LSSSRRELKRLSTVTLSPIYAHFSETLAGLPTIRALRASRRFMTENEERLTVNQRANFGSESVIYFKFSYILYIVHRCLPGTLPYHRW
jgi:ABC-type multidrug transport system fused ATPase/permease subunit